MFFNSKIISFIIGLATALLLLLSLVLIESGVSNNLLLLSFILVFLFTSLISFLILNFFVFKEINNIHSLLQKIKKKDYNIPKISQNQKDIEDLSNPLILIKKEISDFAINKQQEIEDLKKLESFRREFLADVSHELKTPIFAAQGFLHTLLDGAINDLDVRDKFLGKAANSLDGLNVLVADLITISQLEIGGIKMNYTSFDIHKLIEDIFDQLEDTALKKGTKLRFYRFAPKSCYVYADKLRLGQVMTNLIVNALKYGKDRGNVTVSFSVENDNVFVSVKDDGPGIEGKHLSRIFERFYRVEKSRSKDKGGTGLGLAIVKHILEAHNSKIFVSSKVGEGTIFSFKIKKGKVINENG